MKEFDEKFNNEKFRVFTIPNINGDFKFWAIENVVSELKFSIFKAYTLGIQKALTVVEEELLIQEKVQTMAKKIVVVGEKKVVEMVQDRDIRNGKIEVLSDLTSSLKALLPESN